MLISTDNEKVAQTLNHYFVHQENMFVNCIPPYTPLLYRKLWFAGVYLICNFLIFDSKHTLRVLVRTALLKLQSPVINLMQNLQHSGRKDKTLNCNKL